MKSFAARVLPVSVKQLIKPAFVTGSQLIGRNYHTYGYGDQEIQFYYTKTTFERSWGLIDNGEITTEHIPLSVLDSNNVVDAVIDIGAHFGMYSVLLKKLNPQADLYAFEPDDYNRNQLNELLNVNGISSETYGAVVNNETGTVTFYTDSTLGSVRHSTQPRDGFTPVEKPTLALSDLVDTEDINSAFVKIDAEGKELNIVQDLLTANIDYLEGIVELHPDKLTVPVSHVVDLLAAECDQCDFLAETAPEYEYERPMYYFVCSGN